MEVSKALDELDSARAGQRTAILSLQESKRQVCKQEGDLDGARRTLEDLRKELSRLKHVEAAVEATTAQLEAARVEARRRNRHQDEAWSLLSSIGAVKTTSGSPSRSPRQGQGEGGRGDGTSHRGTASYSPATRVAGVERNGGVDVLFATDGAVAGIGDVKAAEISEGIKFLISEWSGSANTIESLTRRLQEEGVRRHNNNARLEALVDAARREAEARGEELAKLVVEFETRAACAEAGMEEKIAKAQTDAALDADRRVFDATHEADIKVAEAIAEAEKKVVEAEAKAQREVAQAVAEAEGRATEAVAAAEDRVAEAAREIDAAAEACGQKERDAGRMLAEAHEALTAAKREEESAVAQARAAVEGQRGAEAALRVLGRFVGPLHRLCLELREQKRFLSRSYRRDSSLQAELFAMAAAVSGRDYWCLLSSGPGISDCDATGSNATAHRHRLCGGVGGGGPVHVPPSLRAVVITVVAANRLAAWARAASAARSNFYSNDGSGGGGLPGSGPSSGWGGRVASEGAPCEMDRRRRSYPGGVGRNGVADARYMARTGGLRSLPVLPPWCCGPPDRPLEMPAAGELEALPDARALETVLARLIVTSGGGGDDGDDGRRFTPGRGGEGAAGPTWKSGGGGGSPDIQSIWGGGGPGVGNLLHHLLRGRKDHMTRVKERCLALDPRPSSSPLWNSMVGDSQAIAGLPRRLFHRRWIGTPGGCSGCGSGGSGGSGCGGGGNCDTGGEGPPWGESIEGGWRVKVGRAVRLELERSVWLGEGPGQPGSSHLRDIRKALAALARGLNDCEAKRLEVDAALRSAGGGVGVAELEESAEVLRHRVELLEAQAAERPVVDVDAVAALEEDGKTATAVGEGLRVQVDRLEEALAEARGEAAKAAAAAKQAKLDRDEAEARVARMGKKKQDLTREVEQLKAFAIRANLEREECLEKERALRRERVDETLNAAAVADTRVAATAAAAERNGDHPRSPICRNQQQQQQQQQKLGSDRSARRAECTPSPVSPRRGLSWEEKNERNQAQARNQQDYNQREELVEQSQQELRRRRKEAECSRARCMQLESRLAEARQCLEEQREVTASMRRAAARAHGDAEAAREETRAMEAQLSRQESECRRQVSLLEARLLEAGVKKSRRRDLLELQASAQEDLVKALREPYSPSTCGETGVSAVSSSDDGDLFSERGRCD